MYDTFNAPDIDKLSGKQLTVALKAVELIKQNKIDARRGSKPIKDMSATLTRSEMEIVERIALGESKKEVAFHTHRSVYTVETTVKNAYDKLGFSKISDLVIWYRC